MMAILTAPRVRRCMRDIASAPFFSPAARWLFRDLDPRSARRRESELDKLHAFFGFTRIPIAG